MTKPANVKPDPDSVFHNIRYNFDDWVNEPNCVVNTSYLINALNHVFLDAPLHQVNDKAANFAAQVLLGMLEHAATQETALHGTALLRLGEAAFLGTGWKAIQSGDSQHLAAFALSVAALTHNKLSVYAAVYDAVHEWTGAPFPANRDLAGLASMLYGELWSQLYPPEIGQSFLTIFDSIRHAAPVLVQPRHELVTLTETLDVPRDF